MSRSMSGRRLVRWVLLLGALGLPASSAATTVVPKTLTELCREADMVFVGTVAQVDSRWKDRERMEIETRVIFSDVTPVYGVAGGDVTLRFAGGEVDGIREQIAGMPTFVPGQRLVILAREGMTVSPIVGFHQGCFRVVDGRAGAVVESGDGRPVTGVEQGDLVLGEPEDGLDGAIPLREFVEHIREILGAPR
jgi:hypothetical protein